MLKIGARKILEPASLKRVPVLLLLYALLFLSLATMAGWLYWADFDKDISSPTTAHTAITPPEPTEPTDEKHEGMTPTKHAVTTDTPHSETEETPEEPHHIEADGSESANKHEPDDIPVQ
ncbi:MAG: hypothetical protein JKX94_12145, partial [Sneathiella sp.]|nr:hypothetical protein [Sneathiella sp.]